MRISDWSSDVCSSDLSGGTASAVQVDLETYSCAEEMVLHAINTYGQVDVLFNNVGGTIWTRPFEKYEPAHIEDEIRRSLFPTLWCTRAVLPFMVERAKGVVVNVSSIATKSVYRDRKSTRLNSSH